MRRVLSPSDFVFRCVHPIVACVLASSAAAAQRPESRAASPFAADSLAGNYLGPRGEMLSLGATDGGSIIYYLSRGERVGRLERIAADQWAHGPGIGRAEPVVSSVAVRHDATGRVARLEWMTGEVMTTYRAAHDTEEEKVAFSSGGVALEGSVIKPVAAGPHPALVLLHGSGPESRRDFHWMRYYLAHAGFVVLSYDKRGVGMSAGDWTSASFEDLANDALAAVRSLKSRPDIDGRHIGLLGWSNGGWIAPLVAVHDEVSFVAVGAAPGTTAGENINYEVEQDLLAAGNTAAEVRAGVALRHSVTSFVLQRTSVTRTAWDTLRTRVEAARAEPWFSRARVAWVLNMPAPPDSTTVAFLRGARAQWSQDPAAAWRKVRKPVLIMLGARDNAVPGAASAARLSDVFKAAGNPAAEVRLYPAGSHALFEVPDAKQQSVTMANRYVPGFVADMRAWLWNIATRN